MLAHAPVPPPNCCGGNTNLLLGPAKRFDDICQWLDPPKSYVDALETSLNLKEEGTCSWILGTPAYQKWLNTESSRPSPSILGKLCPNVLWVYGKWLSRCLHSTSCTYPQPSPNTIHHMLSIRIVQEVQARGRQCWPPLLFKNSKR